MSRVFLYTFLALCLFLGASSCKRKVCPAYYSFFLRADTLSNAFFSYTDADSAPRSDGLFKARQKRWNGLARFQRPGLFSQAGPLAGLTGKRSGKYNLNRTKIIIAKRTYPDSTATTDSVQLASADELLASADSTSAAIAPKEEKKYIDQYQYEKVFGHLLKEEKDSTEENQDSVVVKARKWWQFWKPRFQQITYKKQQPPTDTESGETPPEDLSPKERRKWEKAQKKRKKEWNPEDADQEDNQWEQEPPDEDPDELPDRRPPPKSGKKKRKEPVEQPQEDDW